MLIDAVKLLTVIDFLFANICFSQSNHRFAQPPPIELGTSGGNVAAGCEGTGTLGSLLAIGSSQYILSNNHVLGRSNLGVAGEHVIQPGAIDPKNIDLLRCLVSGVPAHNIVADLSSFIPLNLTNQIQHGNWNESFPLHRPPATGLPGHMAYDQFHKEVVMLVGPQFQYQTWIWNGDEWLQRNTNSPDVSRSLALTYDPTNHVVVLLLGSTGDYYSQVTQTWTWDGIAWTRKSPANPPPPRFGFKLAFDSARSRVVLFGGFSNVNGPLDDTWTWDGADWHQESPADRPPPTFFYSMAYDAIRENVLLFGGSTWSGPINDTWSWNGTNWSHKSPANSPTLSTDTGMVFDTSEGKILLFYGANGNLGQTTWLWDGLNWENASPRNFPTLPASQFDMVYDEERKQAVAYFFDNVDSGIWRNDTWLWDLFNRADAAIAEVRPGQVASDGSILEVGTISSTPMPLLEIRQTLEGTGSVAVKKSGRTTGLTFGHIVDTGVEVMLSDRVFVDQIAMTGDGGLLVDFGDSGSLVVENTFVNPRPIGLVFGCALQKSKLLSDQKKCAKFSFANPVSAVLAGFPGAAFVGSATALSAGVASSVPQTSKALDVKNRERNRLWSAPQVVALGVGPSSAQVNELVIHVYVRELTDEVRKATPTIIDGVKVEIVESGEIVQVSLGSK